MPTEPCDVGCGYVSEGLDLLQHRQFEHARCPECGRAPARAYAAVSHKPDCPRLKPHYAYPPLQAYPPLNDGIDMGEPPEAAVKAAGERDA